MKSDKEIEDIAKMEINKNINNDIIETKYLEVKDDFGDGLSEFTKQIISMANANTEYSIGVVGIDESDGSVVGVPGDVEEIELNVLKNLRDACVPNISCKTITMKFRGEVILIFYVENNDHLLHTYKKNGKHHIPYRDGTATSYLNGRQIHKFYKTGYLPNTLSPDDRRLCKFENDDISNDIIKTSKSEAELGSYYIPLRTFLTDQGCRFRSPIHKISIKELEDILFKLRESEYGNDKYKSQFCIGTKYNQWISFGSAKDYINSIKKYDEIVGDAEIGYKSFHAIFIMSNRYRNSEVDTYVEVEINYHGDRLTIPYGSVNMVFERRPHETRPITNLERGTKLQFNIVDNIKINSIDRRTPIDNSIDVDCCGIFEDSNGDCHLHAKNPGFTSINSDSIVLNHGLDELSMEEFSSVKTSNVELFEVNLFERSKVIACYFNSEMDWV